MFVEPFIPFLLFVLALYATPGPATLSVAASGATYGFRKTISYVFGLIAGIEIIFLLLALGLGALFNQYPTIHIIFKWVSLGYIFYLAYKIATSSVNSKNVKHLGFFEGILLNILNPKAYFAVIATVSQYAESGDGYYSSFIRLILWIFILVIIINFTWSYIGQLMNNKLSSTGISGKVNIVFAILLVISVLITAFM
jgi:threonine/homoserine/homoserine lactone efflux protein